MRTIIAILTVCLTIDALAQTQTERCDKLWADIFSRQSLLGMEGMRREFEPHRRVCAGTGMYESRLALLYSETDRLGEAEKILLEGLRQPNPHHKILRFSLADLDIRRTDYDGAKAKSRALVSDFPDWEGGYRLLAEISLRQKAFKESIEYGLAANRIAPEAGVFLGLTVAYYQLDMHQEAVNAANDAIKLNPKVLGKAVGINEAIYSLVQLGRDDDARRLTRARMNADANWRQDPVLMRAVQYLEKRAK